MYVNKREEKAELGIAQCWYTVICWGGLHYFMINLSQINHGHRLCIKCLRNKL